MESFDKNTIAIISNHSEIKNSIISKAKYLKNNIEKEIEDMGGIDKFNNCKSSNEILLKYIFEILDLLDSMILR